MSQLAKTVYFSDYPKPKRGRSGLTISFPEGLRQTFASVAHMSSSAVRELIGFESFLQLEEAAQSMSQPTATYARELLLKNLKTITAAGQNRTNDYEWAIQSTFKGGKNSPMHNWYPYLEGYSPDFVNSIIDAFVPKAGTILDPFCGSGTTALVATMRRLRCYYSEVNPVCRFVISAKLKALSLSKSSRETIATELETLADNLPRALRKFTPDARLMHSYSAAFGESIFFDAETFDNVLRLRSLLDSTQSQNEKLGRFAELAALRSLIPGSLMIRRGDVRFRTPQELRQSPPQFITELISSLKIIASDLHDSKTIASSAELACTDARQLRNHITTPVDAIITSPPYLNGTNYFRNTKVELWFMRELVGKNDLRKLRDSAITSGINDVTVRKSLLAKRADLPKSLAKVMAAFDGQAYDVRIPLMVEGYFSEMASVISNFKHIVSPGGTVAIDLGDSCYGTVWVPTDRILAEMMEENGFTTREKILLRERKSRDGRKLCQTLHVFTLSKRQKLSKPRTTSNHIKAWDSFKSTLPHQQGEMAKRNWGSPLHSLCSYQGKLKPSIAHTLINAILPSSGGRVLDPFSGVGTIPFEAQRLGHTAFGFDISPAAVAISRAKIEPVDPVAVARILTELNREIDTFRLSASEAKSLENIRFNGPLPEYFNRQTLSEIVAVRHYFAANPPRDGSTSLVFAAMLHILHGNRPYALSRRSHPITPFAPTGPDEYRAVMPRLREKITKSINALNSVSVSRGRMFFQDATAEWPAEVDALDAIITSPPFFDSTRFHTANWMRLWFAGWELSDFYRKPAEFVDERQKTSFEVYDPIFKQAAERLKPNGLMLIHLGKSKKCDMARALDVVARRHLTLIDTFTESVDHCESHGIRDKGTVTHHQYLLLKRA